MVSVTAGSEGEETGGVRIISIGSINACLESVIVIMLSAGILESSSAIWNSLPSGDVAQATRSPRPHSIDAFPLLSVCVENSG